ncbi:hypothetical protein [Peribacillus huizhouensis]|uniref:Membrane protein n=1 Tax=Peribacillus huizhouensis TaxID=1501239 RepID=A0ABR6CM24_9BACI|nr:hypothetical protein [Peribacillus huizhouensis]MBA9026080.1 putative membrane protein [Peribacillus huizhouensis]
MYIIKLRMVWIIPNVLCYLIFVGLNKLYDQVNDEQIKQTAMELIETEEDSKYRKKDLSVWK